MQTHDTEKLEIIRHTLATLAYRTGKALREAPEGFSTFQASAASRTPGQILAHMCDLLDWAAHLCDGRHQWNDSVPQEWQQEVRRFFDGLIRLDLRLSSGTRLEVPVEALFQGPVADALTHVGQIALLRRLAGAPVRGENYFKADICAGRVGIEQSAPRREFD
jgi:hypothetical protein